MGAYQGGPSADRVPAPGVHQRPYRETPCSRPAEGLPAEGEYVCGRTDAHRALLQKVFGRSGVSALGRPEHLSARASRHG